MAAKASDENAFEFGGGALDSTYSGIANCPGIAENTFNRYDSAVPQPTSISLPSATELEDAAFVACDELESITLPSITTIGVAAFYGCSSLNNVVLPSTIQTIGEEAFEDCAGLTSITFTGKTAATVTAMANFPWGIGNVNGATIHCSDEDIVISATPQPRADMRYNQAGVILGVNTSLWSGGDLVDNYATGVGTGAFCPFNPSDGSPTGVASPTRVVMANATTIGEGAFAVCESISSVDTPRVSAIGDSAFYGTPITTFSFPSVVEISGGAFYGCPNLSNVVLPSTLDWMGTAVFGNCSSLTEVTILDKSVSEVQNMSNYPWGIGSGDGPGQTWSATIHCDDGDISINP